MKKLAVIFFITLFQQVFAQPFVDVEDTVLAGILCERFPEAMVNNCTQIDLSKEAFISDTIDISDTTIYDISPLLELTETVYLQLKNNQIDTVAGDFSKLTKLEVLDLSYNEGFSFFPDFGSITSTNFHTLLMSHTDITDTLKISNLKNSLKIINVRNNFLHLIPDFTDFPNLESVNIAANRLTFYNLIPLLDDLDTEYRFFQQRTFALTPRAVLNRFEGVPFELKPDLDSLHLDNVYYWYKDNVLLSITSDPVLNLSNLTLEDSGVYHLILRNPAFSTASDSLYGRPVTLNVIEKLEECVALAASDFEVETTCNVHQFVYMGIEIDSVIYELRPEQDSSFIGGKRNVFVDINNGFFELKVSTPNCEIIYPDYVLLQSKNDCDHIISPNGDGIGDTYFIEKEGEVKIINKYGELLKTMQGPVIWNGKDNSGNLMVPGYYLILFENDESINITVEN